MKINSFSDIIPALFYPLKEWAESSRTNWFIFIGFGLFMLFIMITIIFYFSKKFGKDDERTDVIYKNWAYVVLLTILIGDIILPNEYLVSQFTMYKYVISFLAGNIYFLIQTKKDFN
ncbi:hypothetical protein [Tetragenococcus solitarius]|uniref:hypothetical protein n=1 Tax=Tetragenococcus solitarius TaxID=71453 RepID=UPI00083967A0|nr:hypothetical protein [Tetragenococcus solitarius]